MTADGSLSGMGAASVSALPIRVGCQLGRPRARRLVNEKAEQVAGRDADGRFRPSSQFPQQFCLTLYVAIRITHGSELRPD